MTNREKYRPILLFCLASIGIAVIVAIISDNLKQDDDATEVRSGVPARPAAEVPTVTPIEDNPPSYLEEYSVDLINTDDNKIGTVRVRPTSQGVAFNIFARKLWPGSYAINLHDYGLCEGPDFASAGDHFNPTNATHGIPDHDTDPDEQDHHIGDMRGDRANSQGQLNHRATNASVTLGPTIGGIYSIVDDDGTSLVITFGSDGRTTQAAGVENPRVACAVITQPKSGRN